MKLRTLILVTSIIWLPMLIGSLITCKKVFDHTHDEMCFTDTLYGPNSTLPLDTIDHPDSVGIKAIVFKINTWKETDTMRIFFENGSADEQRQALEALASWGVRVDGIAPRNVPQLKLTAQVVTNRQVSNVRYKFQSAGGSAYVGRSVLFNKNVITIRSSVYSAPHEWGHVLAFIHGQLSGEDPIPWDKPVVYEDMAKRRWSKSQVDRNILRQETDGPRYSVDPIRDITSVMHYSIPLRWILEEFRETVRLPQGPRRWPSARDLERAGEIYGLYEEPTSPPPPPEPKPEPPKPVDPDPVENCEIPDLTSIEIACILREVMMNKNHIGSLSRGQKRNILKEIYNVDIEGLNNAELNRQLIDRLGY